MRIINKYLNGGGNFGWAQVGQMAMNKGVDMFNDIVTLKKLEKLLEAARKEALDQYHRLDLSFENGVKNYYQQLNPTKTAQANTFMNLQNLTKNRFGALQTLGINKTYTNSNDMDPNSWKQSSPMSTNNLVYGLNTFVNRFNKLFLY